MATNDIDPARIVARAAGRIEEITFSEGKAEHVYEVLRLEDAARRFGRSRAVIVGLGVAVAAHVLGISAPKVRLLRHSKGQWAEQAMDKAVAGEGSVLLTDETIGGFASKDPREIGIDLNRTRRRVMRTAAHECRHHWQWKNHRRDKIEVDAEAFADVFMDWFERPVLRQARKLVPSEPRTGRTQTETGSVPYHMR